MSQNTDNNAQKTGQYRNPPIAPSTSAFSSKPQSILASRRKPPELILPKNYTDRDFGSLLSSVITSPELLASNAMVNVFPAASTAGPNLLRSSAEPQGAGNLEDQIAETERKKAPSGLDFDNINDFESTHTDSVVESMEYIRAENSTNSKIIQYKKAEDKQIASIMSSVTPLELVIGSRHNEMCTACFHIGHHHTDFDTCPAARISSLFSQEQAPFYSRLPEKAKARILLMKDIAWACQGLSWAIQYICQGQQREFQIFPGTVLQLHKLIRKWHSVSHDDKFSLGGFVEGRGELTFGEPIQVALIEKDRGPFQQVLRKERVSGLDMPVGDPKRVPKGLNIEIDHHFINSFMNINPKIPNTQVKQKIECDADRLQLEILGNRPAAVCTNCLHRGHAKSSIKICPYLIISLAIERLKSGKKRHDNVLNEIECLEKVVSRMVGPDERKKVEPIVLLIAEWKEATARSPSKGKKPRAISSKLAQAQVINTSINPHESETLAPQKSLVPFHDQVHVPKPPTPTSKFAGLSLLSPSFPVGGNSNSILKDLQPGNNCPPSPPLQAEETQYSENFQHEEIEFSQEADPFPCLEIESDTSGFLGGQGMQALFGSDFELSVFDSFQSLPLDTSSSLDQLKGSFTLSSEKDSSLGMSQSTQSSTYASALSSQQNNNDISYEHNQLSFEENLVDELPAEIFWRTRCPLKLVGNRKDSFCKICLHYGHDKRSQSCLVNVIRIAIAANKLPGVLAVSGTIKDLEAAIRWQGNLPEEIRGDCNMILNLIRRWKETTENLRKEVEDNSETDGDLRGSKRRRCTDILHVPVRRQRGATTIQQRMQIDHGTEDFSLNISEGQFSKALQFQPPHQTALGNHRLQNRTYPQVPQQPPPPSPSQQSFVQKPAQNRPPDQKIDVAPKGWAIDYSRMDSDLFTQISDYIISDGDPADSDNLRVDHQKMPPMLIVAIRKYVIPEKLVSQKARISHPIAHRQQDPPPPMNLQSTEQCYNMQTLEHQWN